MTVWNSAVAVAAAVILFLFGLQSFSRELQQIGGDGLRAWLGRITESRWRAFAVGALATAVVQSSSATSALAVALVDASVLSFRASLGVLLGANVGTTVTVWLVSFKLTGIGSMLIVLAAIVSALPGRARIFGKAMFFFGFIFFALDLVSAELKPLGALPQFQEALALAAVPWIGVAVGTAVTAIIQSSSVTSGLVVILTQQGVLPPEAAISVVVGSNVGSTSTALLAGLGLSPVARATAIANFIFNFTAMLLVLPWLELLSAGFVAATATPAVAVAAAHLAFNLTMGVIFLLAINPVERQLRRFLL